jgi:hypothetical protein
VDLRVESGCGTRSLKTFNDYSYEDYSGEPERNSEGRQRTPTASFDRQSNCAEIDRCSINFP